LIYHIFEEILLLDISRVENALIIGAGHGIGLALVTQLIEMNPRIKIWATYHNQVKANPLLEYQRTNSENLTCIKNPLSEEDDIENLVGKIEHKLGGTNLNLCINCIGFLHNEDIMPEKSLRDINKQQLMKYFEVNSVLTPLLAKHIKKLFSSSEVSAFACISAKVGSLEDNKLGGWYGYRASKAALNMFIKNIAIDYKQSQLKTIVLAIHPGTTTTELSKPFLSHIKHTIWSPDDTAKHIIDVIEKTNIQESGCFKNWDNTNIPW
tara:strand:+ start:147 stop:944 length:798 start_codon:yes stop_codon:yes gene_type:complete